jgi:hypothetical protein
MERAAHHPKAQHPAHPEPVPRDPDLPALSDTALMVFAAAALVATLGALALLIG